MKKSIPLSVIAFLLGLGAFAQPGCQDPQAGNYNPTATSTDGSCTYPLTNVSPTNRIASLPTALEESSALLVTDGKVFTINDSGNDAKLFQIDSTTGAIIKTTTVSNFTNVDWEDLAADSTYIYIGDIGNNDGERTNLRILRLRKAGVYHPDSTSMVAEAIKYSYSDQTSFAPSSTHNFDCEGFFYHKGLLHLFSKNRGNKKTKHYTLPATPGVQVATLQDSLNANGLITSASIQPGGQVATLLGYDNSNLKAFLWLLFGFDSTNYFNGNKRRLELPAMTASGQVEGVGFADDNRLWISNEKLSIIPARVRQLSVLNFIKPFFTEANDVVATPSTWNMYPNPASDRIEITTHTAGLLTLYNALGKVLYSQPVPAGNSQVALGQLPSGLVVVQMETKNGIRMPTQKLLIVR